MRDRIEKNYIGNYNDKNDEETKSWGDFFDQNTSSSSKYKIHIKSQISFLTTTQGESINIASTFEDLRTNIDDI